jgi:hypothetical protein
MCLPAGSPPLPKPPPPPSSLLPTPPSFLFPPPTPPPSSLLLPPPSQLEELSLLERENRALRRRAEVLENMVRDLDKQVQGLGGLPLQALALARGVSQPRQSAYGLCSCALDGLLPPAFGCAQRKVKGTILEPRRPDTPKPLSPAAGADVGSGDPRLI